jgi:hypothetical protein
LKFWSLSGEGSSNCPSLGEETEALLGSLLVKKAKEGFFMAVSIAGLRDFASRSFELIKDSMLQSDSLPLADVLDCQQWRDIFEAHKISFGQDDDSVYTPAVTLWALISQVFFKGELRSCKAAVGRIASLWATLGRTVCSTNTGAYCRARAKLGWQAIRAICCQIAETAETLFDPQTAAVECKQHPSVAAVQAKQTSGRVLLVDGFTVTASDTPENQAVFPQNPAQLAGLGFPIIRGVSLISLVTGLLVDLSLGPYAGKQSGETALLWPMLGRLKRGDTLVADCFYCTYWIVAACQLQGVQIVMKNHDKRDNRPRGARRLDRYQRTTVWLRPQRPRWMSAEQYAQCPAQIEVRLVDIKIQTPGFRAKQHTLATTILETDVFSRDWLANVYRSRWLVELDIRAIKCSLGMDLIRAKSPELVQTEIWSCLLAYNLIRLKMLQSSSASGRMPRTLSFTATQQLLANNWLLGAILLTPDLVELGQQTGVSQCIGSRPDRIEPRANKRRPKLLALLNKPRPIAIQELLST